jgi:hypothetical protein
VVYFAGIATVTAFAAAAAYYYLVAGGAPDFVTFTRGWESIGKAAGPVSTVQVLLASIIGMWAGAASHTLTDISITYIKSGRVDTFL